MKKTDIHYSDIHMHCSYSDGRGSLQDFVESAIEKGFRTIGLSDHSPVPLENGWSMKLSDLDAYINEIRRLKSLYSERIEVLAGIELDFIEGVDVRKYMNLQSRGFDYFIGSVHYVFSEKLDACYEVDGPEESFRFLLEEGFNGDGKKLVSSYFGNVRRMIEEYRPTVVGHIDLVKKNNGNNKYFDEKSTHYINEVDETLATVKKHGAFPEINTGAISRGYKDKLYPSEYILKKCLDDGIGITLNSDAHEPANVGFKFDGMVHMVKKMGFKEIYNFNDGKWNSFLL